MSAMNRGTRNAFRNPIRTSSVIVILGLSFGLVLIMLAAKNAVNNRIAEVKRTVGNTITVQPAGARGFLGGGEPLKQSQADDLLNFPYVVSVNTTIDDQLAIDTDTNLKSAIEPGTLGQRQGRIAGGAIRIGGRQPGNANGEISFTPPIFAIGTNNPNYGGSMLGTTITLTAGERFDGETTDRVALIGKTLAEKNGLSVGSTFTAHDQTITVKGIYDAGNEFANNSVVFPLKTLQTLSGQADQVTAAVVTVDSADHLASVAQAVTSSLGDTADVSSSADTVAEAVKPLANIRTIATTSLYGALGAATIITLLTMVMIVRERRKEIAVLKAIGAGDASIVTQFVTESVVLSLLGSIIGLGIGFALANPITNALVTSSSSSSGPGTEIGGGPGVARVVTGGFRALRGAVESLHSVISWDIVALGLGAAVLVAIIGSALPAWLISKVRPAEVLRND